MKSILGTMREWLATCPYIEQFTGGHIDWTDNTPGNYGLMPTGCQDVSTTEDILGNIFKQKQYNLSLYALNWTVDDVVRLENTDFLDNFQNWIEEQQYAGTTPKFGDNPDEEIITAQNGMLFELAEDGQTGMYQIQISITYEKHYTGKGLM